MISSLIMKCQAFHEIHATSLSGSKMISHNLLYFKWVVMVSWFHGSSYCGFGVDLKSTPFEWALT